MLIASGITLVLITWLALTLVLTLVGLTLALLTQSGAVDIGMLRRSAWWGLLLVTLAVLAGSLWLPIQSTTVGVLLILFAVFLGGLSIVLARNRGWSVAHKLGRTFWIVAIPLVGAVIALAAAALGPVTNYDSGLYHLGAIGYAAQYPAIPGLANLYQPLGYATAQFPLAAAMGVGPWGEEGFRLLNGFVIFVVIADLASRFLRKAETPGRWIQLVGTTALLVSMVALADYWVTSPSQDASVFALSVVGAAYLSDAVTDKSRFAANGSTALVISIMAVLIRPTMVFFAAGVGLAFLIRMWMWRKKEYPERSVVSLVVVFAAGAVGLILSTARDYLLSGWFQYPLSLFAFQVPWGAADPSSLRDATLGFHRNREDIEGSVSGFEWVGPWLSRAVSEWEAWLVGVMLAAAVVVLLVAKRKGPVGGRLLALSMLPSSAAVTAWFLLSPPAFRFAWGPLVTLAAVPAGWGLWLLIDRARSSTWHQIVVFASGLSVVIVSVVTLVARTEWSEMSNKRQWSTVLPISYAVASVQSPEVEEIQLPSGLKVISPVDDPLCWSAFPLCTPQIGPDVHLRSNSIRDGFERY